MKRTISQCSLLFILVCTGIQAQAQNSNLDNLVPVSPTAFQFLKYTEVPVSEYTGIPSIAIPLYEINEDGVRIPLTLTYHAGGIRVSQEASWVGLGWDLAIGSVVQIINDVNDFGNDTLTGQPHTRTLPDYHQSPIPSEFPRRYNYPFTSAGFGWTDPYPVYSPTTAHSFKIATDNFVPVNGAFGSQQTNLFTSSWVDSEPDIFKANFCGHSISFIRNTSATNMVVLGKKGYIVTRVNDTWKIIVPSGDEFYFEQKSEIVAQSTTTTFYGNYGTSYVRSSNIWMLTKVITKNKREITFAYSTTSLNDCYPNYSEKWNKYTTNSGGGLLGGAAQAIGITGTPGSPPQIPTGLTKTNSRSKESYVYLSSITFPKGQITFTTSSRTDMAGAKKLDNIQVQASQIVRTVQFNYSYFDAGSSTGNGFTLFDQALNGALSAQRLKLLSVQDNSGAVHTFTYNSTALPWKNSFGQDYWGFYNGETSNTSLIPNPTQFNLPALGNNGNNHSANLTYAKAWTLEEIKYPTGGTTSFEYELHEFDNYWVPDFSSSSNTTSKGYGLRVKSVTSKAYNTQSLKTKYTYTGGKAILPLQMFRTYNVNGITINNSVPSAAIAYYTIDEVSAAGFFSSSQFGTINGVGYGKVVKEEVDIGGTAKGKTETNFHNNPDIFIHSASSASQVSSTLPAIKNFNYPENGSVESVLYYNDQNTLLRKIESIYTNTTYSIYYGARIFGYSHLVYAVDYPLPTYWWNHLAQNLIGYYPIFDFVTLPQTSTETEYANSTSLVTTTSNVFDTYHQLAYTSVTGSGVKDEIEYHYPYEYPSIPVLDQMFQANRLSDIVATTKYKNNIAGTNQKTIAHVGKTFVASGNKFLESYVNSIEHMHLYDNKPTEIFYDQYDANANLLQYTTKNVTHSTIRDYNSQYVIANVTNAPVSLVAYTSFEADGKGNWTFTGTPFQDMTSPTGKKAYILSSGSISKSSLDNTKTYTVSYWSKNGVQNVNSTSGVAGRSVNGWTYYQHKVVNPNTITVSGTGIIDELRLYPEKAIMTTYTHEPLVGISAECDINNRINYYHYDGAGRLIFIRDQDKNVVKKICYNYASQTENCTIYTNVEKSGNYTRNNCPGGYSGGSTTYIVPEGTYFSIVSTADANQQAQNDVNANGQTFANSTGTCPTIYYNVVKSGDFTRNNCPSGYTPSMVTYTVPAGTYNSISGQSHVDGLAQNDVNTNGQAYANAHGSCTPSCNSGTCNAQGYKCVNGVCELGIPVVTECIYDDLQGTYTYTYHYEWSDASWSQDYTVYDASSCL